MAFPIAHALLGTSIVIAGSPQSPRHIGWKPLLIGAALGIVPDLDFIGVWFFNLDESWHRGFSHSILIAFAVGALMSLWTKQGTRIRWALVYGAAMASHGLADVLTSIKGGVSLLWPISPERFAAGLFEYPDFPIEPMYPHLATTDGIQLLQVSGIEFMALSTVLILTWTIKERTSSRFSPNRIWTRSFRKTS